MTELSDYFIILRLFYLYFLKLFRSGNLNEKNISTQQNQTRQNPRFSRQNGDCRRPQSIERAQSERPRQIDSIVGNRVTENSLSFPSELRLNKPDDYKKVFAKPVKSGDQYFTLLAIRNDLDHPRLGLAIAKKQIKKAVHRNAIKRAVRENFRMRQHSLGSMDIVVLARREAIDAPLETLGHSLEKHWSRLVSRCASCS